jgi:hypothetical protein
VAAPKGREKRKRGKREEEGMWRGGKKSPKAREGEKVQGRKKEKRPRRRGTYRYAYW